MAGNLGKLRKSDTPAGGLLLDHQSLILQKQNKSDIHCKTDEKRKSKNRSLDRKNRKLRNGEAVSHQKTEITPYKNFPSQTGGITSSLTPASFTDPLQRRRTSRHQSLQQLTLSPQTASFHEDLAECSNRDKTSLTTLQVAATGTVTRKDNIRKELFPMQKGMIEKVVRRTTATNRSTATFFHRSITKHSNERQPLDYENSGVVAPQLVIEGRSENLGESQQQASKNPNKSQENIQKADCYIEKTTSRTSVVLGTDAAQLEITKVPQPGSDRSISPMAVDQVCYIASAPFKAYKKLTNKKMKLDMGSRRKGLQVLSKVEAAGTSSNTAAAIGSGGSLDQHSTDFLALHRQTTMTASQFNSVDNRRVMQEETKACITFRKLRLDGITVASQHQQLLPKQSTISATAYVQHQHQQPGVGNKDILKQKSGLMSQQQRKATAINMTRGEDKYQQSKTHSRQSVEFPVQEYTNMVGNNSGGGGTVGRGDLESANSFLQQRKLTGKGRDVTERILRNAMSSNRRDAKSSFKNSVVGSAKLSSSMCQRNSGHSLLTVTKDNAAVENILIKDQDQTVAQQENILSDQVLFIDDDRDHLKETFSNKTQSNHLVPTVAKTVTPPVAKTRKPVASLKRPRSVTNRIKQSFRVLKNNSVSRSSELQEESNQCLAICFEGVCASIGLADPSVSNLFWEQQQTTVCTAYLRENFIEALASFKKATPVNVTILLYTFMCEERLDLILGSTLTTALASSNGDLIDRIIYLEGCRFSNNFPQVELEIPREYLPENTTEILWIHPLEIDFLEVQSRVKTRKQHEKLFLDADVPSVRTVRCLPKVAQSASMTTSPEATVDKEPREEVLEYTLLISSIDFDAQDGKASASMLAIMKTIQSLFFLGKITHLISQMKTKEWQVAAAKPSLVPAAVPHGLVPPINLPAAAIQKTASEILISNQYKTQVTYSWRKSFTTIKQHMLLSLVAFEAPEECFDPDMSVKNKAGNLQMFRSTLSVPASQVKAGHQKRLNYAGVALAQYEESKRNDYLCKVQVLTIDQQAKLQSTASILEIASSKLVLQQSTQATVKDKVEAQELTATAPGGVKTSQANQAPQQPRTIMSYEKPTISSGLQAITIPGDSMKAAISSLMNEAWSGQPNNTGVQLPHSPRNQALKLLRDLKAQNKEISKHIKAYNTVRRTGGKVAAAQQQSSAQFSPKNNSASRKKQDATKPIAAADLSTKSLQEVDDTAEQASRKVMVLDGWLLEKYPLIKLERRTTTQL